MNPFKSSLRGFGLLTATLVIVAAQVKAQNLARVEKIQRTVEKQAGQSPKWVHAIAGTTLVTGERLRTGKRAKSDLRFSDKSLLRLGQLSSLELRGAREVRLLQGQLLLSALSPARILAGSATAAIKGTVPLIKVLPNGDAEFALYSGEVELTTPSGTLTLLPGQWVSVSAEGQFSKTKSVAPFFYMHGNTNFDLLIPPRKEPFVGSDTEIRLREEPSRELFELAVDSLSRESNQFNPFDDPRGGTTGGGTTSGTTSGTTAGTTSGTTTGAGLLESRLGGFAAMAAVGTSGTSDTGSGIGIAGAGGMGGDTSAIGSTATATIALSESSGESHLDEVNPNAGLIGFIDAQLLGATSTGPGDGSVYAGRLAASGGSGKTFFEVAVIPLRSRQFGTTSETAFVTRALMTYRTKDFDIKAGRQLIWDGPLHATSWGTMLRQGSRNTFDAVRISSNPDKRLTYDLAYLVDAYPRLPAQGVAGRQRGYYGRVEMRDENYAVGLNGLHFINAPSPSTTGVTVDFVLPVARDYAEFYGEVGRDPFKRKTNTFGLNFPILYEKTGIDLFLETAKTDSTANYGAPNRELAARLYRKFGNHLNLMVAANKFQGSDTRVVIGLTIGKNVTLRDDAFESFIAKQ